MNSTDHLERDLTAWLADAAASRVPDFTDDILNLTAGTNQRPRWSFPERWLPMSVITLGRQTVKPFPWRTIGLLAVLALLLAAVAVYVGSRPRLPAPFGPAANGLVAYSQNGDIFAVDPISGVREAIATGPGTDYEPRWSLDGTRVAFLRTSTGLDAVLVIVDRRSRDVLATTEPLVNVDPDAVAWSPDGRSIAVGAQHGAWRAIYIVDARTGDLTPLAIDYVELDVYWRPPDGRQLMFFGRKGTDVGLHLVTVGDGTVTEVARPARPGETLRPSGWTPDGQRVVFQRGEHDGMLFRTHVLDLATREEIIIDAAFGHVSNDGSRILAIDERARPCVASISGGPCIQIGEESQVYVGAHAAGAQWSPDDEWIISRVDEGRAVLLDPDGGNADQPSWVADGAESWQRVAP